MKTNDASSSDDLFFTFYGASLRVSQVAAFYTEEHFLKWGEFRFVFILKCGEKIKSPYLLKKQVIAYERIIKKKFQFDNITRREYETGYTETQLNKWQNTSKTPPKQQNDFGPSLDDRLQKQSSQRSFCNRLKRYLGGPGGTSR